jgi:hypothetical protein
MSPRTRANATARPLPVLLLLLLLTLLGVGGPAQAAADQPEVPGDFRNGQENRFGSIAMAPYLSAGDASIPIEARIVLRDLAALRESADVLFAFNVKGDAVRATFESLRTSDGRVLVPVATATVDDGRQPQAHFAPADLLAVAAGGRIDLVLAGRAEAKADSQSHVGAMVIAFDGTWGTVPSGDGSAQLYGFTMVSSTGLGGGAMPFQGQGNTWAMLPPALLALVVALAGAMAVPVAARMPPAAAAPAAPATPASAREPAASPGPKAIPTFGQAAARPPALPPVVPVFGGPASPKLAPRPTPPAATPARPPTPLPRAGQAPPAPAASPAAGGPMQGPLLPSHPLDRSPVLRPSAVPRASPGGVAAAAHSWPGPAKPAASGGRAVRGRPAPRTAGVATVMTATRRPKAKAGSGRPEAAAPPPGRRPTQGKRATTHASR